jgi:hypothetical protein
MQKTLIKLLSKLKNWRYLYMVFVLLSYLFFTFYYMTPSIVDCRNTVYGFGDNTAGPIWTYQASGGAFLPSVVQATNYPDGENLASALSVASIGQRVIYWPLAKIAGPICGYNILNILGFMSTALIMFGFIHWLTRSKWIAWLAGYAVAFVPYMQMKTGPHPSYAFSGILVGIMWLTLSIIYKPTRYKALGLGALGAFCVYFDPYFVLYGFLVGLAVLVPFSIFLAISIGSKGKYNTLASLKPIRALKTLGLAVLVSVLLLVPYAMINISSMDSIQKKVTAVRGNVVAEAQACANYPHEYLLPFVLHPISKSLGINESYIKIENKLKNNFSCGIGEDTVGVSLALVLLLSTSVLIVVWEKINRRKLISKRSSFINLGGLTIISAGTLLFFGVVFGLSPTQYFGIPTPTKILLEITTTWRTISRSFLLVNIALVALAAIALYFYSQNKKISPNTKKIFFVIIFLMVFVEYQAFPVFKGNILSNYDYKNDIPAVYKWISKQQNIASIAEYPMESYGESDLPSYYLTMQYQHGKKILAATSPDTSMEIFRKSIKNINDPQTIPALSALGIDAVVLHGIDRGTIEKFKLAQISDYFPQPRFNIKIHTGIADNDNSIVISPKKAYKQDSAIIGLLTSGFYRNLGIIKYPEEWAYEAVQGAKIDIKNIKDGKFIDSKTKQEYCFNIRASAPSDVLVFRPIVDGNIVPESYIINHDYRQIKLSVEHSIVLQNDKGSNMQITRLGCSQ